MHVSAHLASDPVVKSILVNVDGFWMAWNQDMESRCGMGDYLIDVVLNTLRELQEWLDCECSSLVCCVFRCFYYEMLSKYCFWCVL